MSPIARVKEKIRELTRRTGGITSTDGQAGYDLSTRMARILQRLANTLGAAEP
jgi:hypothetical protein